MSLEQSSLWLPGSPASLPVLRVSAEVRLMLDGSGRKSRASFAPASPLLSCLKTFLASSVWDSMTFSAIWTARATKARRVFIRLRRLERRTSGNECSSWPTPTSTAGDGRSEQTIDTWTARRERTLAEKGIHNGLPLNVAVQMWPTPTVNGDYNRKGASPTSGDGLATVVRLWPSPIAGDAKRGSATYPRGNLTLKGTVTQWSTPAAQDAKNATLPASQATRDTLPGDLLRANTAGRLNPDWVSQLMGYPDGWLDIPSMPTDGPPAPVKRSTSGKRRAPSRPATEHPDAPRN